MEERGQMSRAEAMRLGEGACSCVVRMGSSGILEGMEDGYLDSRH